MELLGHSFMAHDVCGDHDVLVLKNRNTQEYLHQPDIVIPDRLDLVLTVYDPYV